MAKPLPLVVVARDHALRGVEGDSILWDRAKQLRHFVVNMFAKMIILKIVPWEIGKRNEMVKISL